MPGESEDSSRKSIIIFLFFAASPYTAILKLQLIDPQEVPWYKKIKDTGNPDKAKPFERAERKVEGLWKEDRKALHHDYSKKVKAIIERALNWGRSSREGSMKGVLILAVLLLFLLLMVVKTSVVRYAATIEYPEVGASAEAAEVTTSGGKHLRQVSGEVTAVDREKMTITVEGITILADEELLANIKEGDRVTVDYFTRGMNRAINIIRELR